MKSKKPLKIKGFSGQYLFYRPVMVAGVGLEPHGLRVMSPTSYHLLYPASKVYLNDSLSIIP